MQRTTPTVILATIAASGATLLMALSPALAPLPPQAALPVVELPRVVITAQREPRVVELPRVVITARRADATMQTADAGQAAQPLMQQRAF